MPTYPVIVSSPRSIGSPFNNDEWSCGDVILVGGEATLPGNIVNPIGGVRFQGKAQSKSSSLIPVLGQSPEQKLVHWYVAVRVAMMVMVLPRSIGLAVAHVSVIVAIC